MGDHRRRGDTTRKGYGRAHQLRRARWAPLVEAGVVRCHRDTCGQPIIPGTPWDLGHRDNSGKRIYSGPEHQACNRSAGAQQRNTPHDPPPSVEPWW